MGFSVNSRTWREGGVVSVPGPSCRPSVQGVNPPVCCVLAVTYVRGSFCWLLAPGLQFLSGGGGADILAPGLHDQEKTITLWTLWEYSEITFKLYKYNWTVMNKCSSSNINWMFVQRFLVFNVLKIITQKYYSYIIHFFLIFYIIEFFLNVTVCFRTFKEHSNVSFHNVGKMIQWNIVLKIEKYNFHNLLSKCS